jgi:hypothetical protein
VNHPAATRQQRPRPARLLLAVAGVLLAALLTGSIGPGTSRAGAIGYSPLVEAPAPYEGQTTCTRAPRPGTVALARWLTSNYRVTGSMGTMRACRTGGRSEHKDGRAFDWKADATRKATRRAAYDFIRKALATDEQGNPNALARRMGIMYLIYDDKIWSSYRGFQVRPYLHAACKKRRKCSRTLRHRDHVHISLSHAGAAAQTSWYRARGVDSEPVLHPGTEDLDADDTAVTGLTVPAGGAVVSSSFHLRAGVTYRIVATGTAGYDPAPATGDANCTAAGAGAAYAPTPRGPLVDPTPIGFPGWGFGWGEGSEHPASPYAAPTAETHGLLVNAALRWEGGCQADHTYEAWFTPDTRQRLQVQYADPAPGDNSGAFTVYVARDDITRASLVG